MNNVKYFEVRDSCTYIPVIAVMLAPTTEDVHIRPQESSLLGACGYPSDSTAHFLVTRLSDSETHNSPFDWGSNTMAHAHRYIVKMWKELDSGDVVDVEFIKGISSELKRPQRLEG